MRLRGNTPQSQSGLRAGKEAATDPHKLQLEGSATGWFEMDHSDLKPLPKDAN
jgi:hypothetical protein